MYTITVTHIAQAPIADVWASWDDFANIDRFNPNVRRSRLIGDKELGTGPGARRECELTDGRNWLRERIVEYLPQQKLGIEVYETSLPVRSMVGSVSLRRKNETETEVRMTASFEPKRGLLGTLMAPMMKRKFRRMLSELLACNDDYVRGLRHLQHAA